MLLFHLSPLLLLLLPRLSEQHGLMLSPAPRTGTTNAGNAKGRGRGPCGRGPLATKGAVSATFQAGEAVAVRYQTDIPHGGTCVISISNSPAAQPPTNARGILQSAGAVNAVSTPAFPCCQQRGVETQTVTIPADFSCENCVLQWFWDGDSDYVSPSCKILPDF